MRPPMSVGVALVVTLLLLLGWVCGAHAAGTDGGSDEREIERFKAAIETMKIAWDPGDPRAEPERIRALSAFMTETYGGADSFGVPASLLKGNPLSRAVWDYDAVLGTKVGLVLWPANPRLIAYGISAVGTPAGLRHTSNCVMCHVAEIDGIVYFGAGSKVFDEKSLADIALKATNPVGRVLLGLTSPEREAMARVHEILSTHRHPKTNPLTRGRSTAFVRSHVELYRAAHTGRMPPADAVGRGDTKVPPLWHYAAKRPFGRWYVDGSFRGEHPMMASSMELAKGRSPSEIERVVMPTIAEQFESVIAHLRPPRYPYPIDPELAEQGRRLFYSDTIGCYKCHGTYDGDGRGRWTGRHIDVGTDGARASVVSGGFLAVFAGSPLATRGSLVGSRGYAATPLTGVWANFPYLHNGSVPTLYHLLGPAAERPRIFWTLGARHFDRDRVGQQLFPGHLDAKKVPEAALMERWGGDRDWFNATRPGCGNMGHDFWPRIATDENRRALIEYLKTL